MPEQAMNLRRFHRLIGLLVSLPCVLWGLSGGVLAWKNWARDRPKPTIEKAPILPRSFQVGWQTVRAHLQRSDEPLAIERRHVLGAPRYLVRFATPPNEVMLDGETGAALPQQAISEREALQIATSLSPQGVDAQSVRMQTEPSLLYLAGMELPVYRVSLSDGSEAFVSPTTGEQYFRADGLARLIRRGYFWLHVWRFSSGPGPHVSYLLLAFAGGILTLSGLSGVWLALAPRRRREPLPKAA